MADPVVHTAEKYVSPPKEAQCPREQQVARYFQHRSPE